MDDKMYHSAGDIVLFKGKGALFAVLSMFLGVFYPNAWRPRKWKPWHVGIIHSRTKNGYIVFEALSRGAVLNYRDDTELVDARIFHYLDTTQEYIEDFIREHEHCKYDVMCYLWTFAQYVLLRIIGWFQDKFHIKASISLPRVLDNRFTCWELVYHFCWHAGKPIEKAAGTNMSRYPLITDLLKVLEG